MSIRLLPLLAAAGTVILGACGSDNGPTGPALTPVLLDGGGGDALPTPACLAAPDGARLRGWLARLTGEEEVVLGPRRLRISERASAEGRADTRAYLQAELEALGYAVTPAPYTTGINLVAVRPGSGAQALVVGAHLDTVPGVPGADDNASGLALQLTTALALRGCRLGHELRLVAFDEEELGLLGSRGYVGELRNAGRAAEVLGMLNLDMMGYDGDDDGAYTIFECGRSESAFLVDALLDANRGLGLALTPSRQCTGGGDHRTFWDARIPAVAFGEEYGRPGADINPCYHLPCDRVDRLNMRYLANLAHLTAAATARLVKAE